MSTDPRYVIADGWTHIFSPEFGEELIRWVYDRETSHVVDAKVAERGTVVQREDGSFALKGGWRDASDQERAEIEESVTIANSSCLDNPEEWELDQAHDLPDWATATPPVPPRR